MLDITGCSDHFATVKAFAKERGLLEQLQAKLDYLDSYANGEGCLYASPDRTGTRCRLFRDSVAPHSFEFVMEHLTDRKYTRWFNGGLLFFDDGDNGVGSPQFSVRVGETKAGWSIHT